MERKLLVNRVQCLECGKILVSKYTHDYNVCGCANGTMVDGGLSYGRYGGADLSKVDNSISIYTDSPFDMIRENFQWGSRGKDGKQEVKYNYLKDMSNSHIENILFGYREHVHSYLINIFEQEADYRLRENIMIED